MAKNRFVCSACGAKTPIQAFCQQCGQPTPVCTPDERILWEMGQWESSRSRQGKPVRSVSLPLRKDPNAPAEIYEPPASTRRQVAPIPEQPMVDKPATPPVPMRPAARTPTEQSPAATTPSRPDAGGQTTGPRSVPIEPAKRSQRPAGPQIAAAAAASSAANALELNVAAPEVTEAPARRQVDKSAALQRIIRNIPRHTTTRTPAPAGESIIPETADHAARRAALEEAARIAAQMEEEARIAQETEERERQEHLERVMREAEERARVEAEERARAEAEEKARLEALEQARLDAERKAQEAEARARAAEEAARMAEEQARIAEEERARRVAEERARLEAEEKVLTAQFEAAKAEAEEQARREAEERAKAEAEEKARLEAAREAMKEAEERQREAERVRREAEAEAEAAQRAAEKEAKRLAREQAENQKLAEKRAKKEAKEAAAAAAKAARVAAEAQQQEETGEQPAKPQRKSRLDRRYDRQVAALGLLDGETVTIMADGRSGLRRATMFITRYRVAIVGRSRRRTMVRWIPLEEVTKVETAWRGAPTVIVHATIEVLPFKQRAKSTMQQLTQLVKSEVREARSGGGRRHSADLMQDWNDRMNHMMDSSAGRFRLWIRRHPWFTLVWLASLVPVAYFIARSRI